jgi:hypothetical protein
MRGLNQEELVHVSGAGGSYSCCYCPPSKGPSKSPSKGNNGFGNGGRDGVPGKSGKQDYTR